MLGRVIEATNPRARKCRTVLNRGGLGVPARRIDWQPGLRMDAFGMLDCAGRNLTRDQTGVRLRTAHCGWSTVRNLMRS
jgi:hypothetical protein